MTAAQMLAAQVAAFLALLLAASAVHKGLRFAHARHVVQDFAGVPRWAATSAVVASSGGEVLSAALLVAPGYRVLGALLAALILTVYLALIVRSLAAGRSGVDCGCSFAPVGNHSPGAFEACRNAVLVALALLVAASAVRGGAAIAASQGLAACALVALYVALDQIMGLEPMRKGTVL